MAEVDRVADVVEGFHELVPIVFHYGHLSPDGNEKLYRALTSTLAMTFEKRCDVNKTSEMWPFALLLLLLLLLLLFCCVHSCIGLCGWVRMSSHDSPLCIQLDGN